ncbi:pro-resilin isoform X2 [Camponotus floridanus]|uniref:pro-resilin isoform X2 n=1 Tax=Camponotus floridanus TaxID=104421 RepID=UPI000971733F|nr:pro-resilin isoform X2 [Camponotus floridanus]
MSPGIYKERSGPHVCHSLETILCWKGRKARAGRTTLPWRDKVTKICFLCRWKAPSIFNMFKIGIITFITLAMTRSEPPVNSYLPSRTGISGANDGQADLSTQYGTPDFGNGGNANRNGGATSFSGPGGNGAGNGPSKLYDAPIGGNARVNGLGQSRRNGFGNGQSSSYSASSFGDFSETGGNVRPSSSYGVPIANGNNGDGFRNGDNGDKPSINYGVPGINGNNGDRNRGNGERPSTNYGAPGANGNHGGGSSGNNNNGRPSTSYGVPANGNTNGKNHFNGGSNGNGGKLSSNYESPNVPKINGFGTNGGLSSSYGPPDRNGHGNNGYPSESPTRNGEGFRNGGANGYPSGGGTNGHVGNFENGGGSFKNEGRGNGGYNDNAQEESTEPAKYEFSYEVKDEQSGSNYGHKETRNGDHAQGEFNVLLPDGRKQIVEYEADQDGFKPQIRYEGEANTGGGYSSGGPNGNNDGYSSGRPDSKSGGFADNSGFNGGGTNGYPNGSPGEGKPNGFNGGGNGYQSGKSGQSFSRDNDNNLNGNIGGYFSNAPSNHIGDNADIGNNRQNGNGGYQY